MDAGGYVRIYFPAEVTVSPRVDNCRDVDDKIKFSSCTANTEKNYIELIVQTAIELEEG